MGPTEKEIGGTEGGRVGSGKGRQEMNKGRGQGGVSMRTVQYWFTTVHIMGILALC